MLPFLCIRVGCPILVFDRLSRLQGLKSLQQNVKAHFIHASVIVYNNISEFKYKIITDHKLFGIELPNKCIKWITATTRIIILKEAACIAIFCTVRYKSQKGTTHFLEILTSKENQSYLPPKEDLCQCLSPSHISCAKSLDPVESNKQGSVFIKNKRTMDAN